MRAQSLIKAGGLSLLVACAALGSSDDGAPRPPADAGADALAACGAGEKACGGRCVATNDPSTGCGARACDACELLHAEATCLEGACAPQTCLLGWGDCDGDPSNGCETATDSSSDHCGACSKSCGAGRVCAGGACELSTVTETRAWLASKTAGFCAAAYNQVLNLCGDVRFCFDPRVMRPYPGGLGIDLGFYVGQADRGQILSIGGECEEQRIQVFLVNGSLHLRGQGPLAAQVALPPGKHLLSIQWTARGGAVFLDGKLVAHLGAPAKGVRLLPACGPGLILGNRHSYWWEHDREPEHASAAYFFFQVREGVPDALAWNLRAATQAGPGTVVLYDERGVQGTNWAPSVGDIVGVGKNSRNSDQDPRIDVPPDAPAPAWMPLAACAVR